MRGGGDSTNKKKLFAPIINAYIMWEGSDKVYLNDFLPECSFLSLNGLH